LEAIKTNQACKRKGEYVSNITRIFRVQIKPELRDEFEPLFQSVSMKSVQDAKGFISAQIGKPSHWSPNEYVMISTWETEPSL